MTEKTFNTDLYRPIEEILEDVRTASTYVLNQGGNIAFVVTPLATLLVKLSREAEDTARALRSYTKWLLGFTAAVVFLAVVLIAMEGFKLYQEGRFGNAPTHGLAPGYHAHPMASNDPN